MVIRRIRIGIKESVDKHLNEKQNNKVEKQDKTNINVFGYEAKQSSSIYVSKTKFDNCINFILTKEDENKHYVLIKFFNRFMFNKKNMSIENVSVCIAYNVSVKEEVFENSKQT